MISHSCHWCSFCQKEKLRVKPFLPQVFKHAPAIRKGNCIFKPLWRSKYCNLTKPYLPASTTSIFSISYSSAKAFETFLHFSLSSSVMYFSFTINHPPVSKPHYLHLYPHSSEKIIIFFTICIFCGAYTHHIIIRSLPLKYKVGKELPV